MKLNWNFRRGGGVIGQIPSVGGYGYFLEPHIPRVVVVGGGGHRENPFHGVNEYFMELRIITKPLSP